MAIVPSVRSVRFLWSCSHHASLVAYGDDREHKALDIKAEWGSLIVEEDGGH